MPAPTALLNQAVIEASWGGLERVDEAVSASAVMAFQLGWAIEELVALGALTLQPAETAKLPPNVIPEFPADLGHVRTAGQQLESVARQALLWANKLHNVSDTGSSPAPVVSSQIEVLVQGGASRAAFEQAVADWDAFLVDELLDRPHGILAAYETGKALNVTYWKVWFSMHNQAKDSIYGPWLAVFGAERTGAIRRSLATLLTVLDRTAVTTVAASVEYWCQVICKRADILEQGLDPGQDSKGLTLRLESLLKALDQQRANWYDLLTYRRVPQSFPVTALVTAAVEDAAGSWQPRAKRASRLAAGVALALLLAGLSIGAVVLLVGSLLTPTAGWVTGVGAGISTAIGLAGVRLSTGLARFRDLQSRMSGIEDQLMGNGSSEGNATRGTTPPVTWQALTEQVLGHVVAQLRLEELNLAVSEPLVSFVLDQRDGSESDPAKRLANFINLVDADANLVRLQTILKGLYNAPARIALGLGGVP
jgi:hypothetical protein